MPVPKRVEFQPIAEEVRCPNCGTTVTVVQLASWETPHGMCPQCGKDILVTFDIGTWTKRIVACKFTSIYGLQIPEENPMNDAEKLKAIDTYLEKEVLESASRAFMDIRSHSLMFEKCTTGKAFLDQTMTLASAWLDLQVTKRCEQMAIHILEIIRRGGEE